MRCARGLQLDSNDYGKSVGVQKSEKAKRIGAKTHIQWRPILCHLIDRAYHKKLVECRGWGCPPLFHAPKRAFATDSLGELPGARCRNSSLNRATSKSDSWKLPSMLGVFAIKRPAGQGYEIATVVAQRIGGQW